MNKPTFNNNMDTEGIDPTLFSVMLGHLNSIAEEMTYTLENAAFTPILSLSRDYSCCVYDSQERQVAMVDALPIHTNSLRLVLRAIADAFKDDIHEGDTFLCNDPYSGNTHVADLVTACPVFWEGRLMFWSVVRGNQLDVGAAEPHSTFGGAANVWQEGITIPPLKSHEKGVPRKDVIELYLANVRYRDLLRGDLMAQLGSIWTGERRLREVCARYGNATVQRYLDSMIDYGRRRTQAEIHTMPNGVYVAEGWLDTDGSTKTDLLVKCTVTIEDESIVVDFAGSDPSGAHGLNSSWGTLQAAGTIPIMMAIDPDIPHNEGCMSCITVKAPVGSLCNAKYPASTAQATVHPSDLMQDVVCKALAQAIPDRIRSGSSHWATAPMLSGRDEETGTLWGHLSFNGGGGGPAANGADGWPVIVTMAGFGGLKTTSIEHTELLNPFSIDFCEIAIDTAGLGQQIGGPGIYWAIRPLKGDIDMMYSSDGVTNPPFGVGGGTAGEGGGSYIERVDGTGPRAFVHCALAPITIPHGTRWIGVSPGGGGWGDPLRRPIEQVVEDVRDELYSAERAPEIYGVVFKDGPGFVMDPDATAERRAEIGATRIDDLRTRVVPTEPRVGDWFERHRREGDLFIAPMAWEGSFPVPHGHNNWAGSAHDATKWHRSIAGAKSDEPSSV